MVERLGAPTEREVELAVAPYRGVLPPEVIDEMREAIRDALVSHPVLGTAFARVRPPPVLAHSHEMDRGPDGRQEAKPPAPVTKLSKPPGVK